MDIFRDLAVKQKKEIIPDVNNRYRHLVIRNGFNKPEEHISTIMVRVIYDISVNFVHYHKSKIAEAKS